MLKKLSQFVQDEKSSSPESSAGNYVISVVLYASAVVAKTDTLESQIPCPHVQFQWALGPRFLLQVSAS